MTKKEKELLLKDLFTRVPYGVKGNINGNVCNIVTVNVELQQFYIRKENGKGGTYSVARGDNLKLYLRPMSSMTEEENFELDETRCYTQLTLESYDWLNAHHFDYRGLISMGFALPAPEGMYKID